MRSPRSLLFTSTAVVLLTACENDPTTVVGRRTDELASDLTIVAPLDVSGATVARNAFDAGAAPEDAPARAAGDLGNGGTYGGSQPSVPESGIFDAKTRANFLPGQLSVIGSHDFIGNMGSVETKASLSYEGSVIGTQTSFRSDAYPFLWPPWDVHSIWTEARIYTDRECGLSGWGDSRHKAWWEAVMGGPVSSFSVNNVTTNASRAFQPECPPAPPPTDDGAYGGGYGGGFGGGGEDVCYFLITYNTYTGQIYDQELLYCTWGG